MHGILVFVKPGFCSALTFLFIFWTWDHHRSQTGALLHPKAQRDISAPHVVMELEGWIAQGHLLSSKSWNTDEWVNESNSNNPLFRNYLKSGINAAAVRASHGQLLLLGEIYQHSNSFNIWNMSLLDYSATQKKKKDDWAFLFYWRPQKVSGYSPGCENWES